MGTIVSVRLQMLSLKFDGIIDVRARVDCAMVDNGVQGFITGYFPLNANRRF